MECPALLPSLTCAMTPKLQPRAIQLQIRFWDFPLKWVEKLPSVTGPGENDTQKKFPDALKLSAVEKPLFCSGRVKMKGGNMHSWTFKSLLLILSLLTTSG